MRPKCSDKEFIDVWNKFKSTSEVAKYLDMGESNVRARRRNMEEKYNITLPTFDR